MPSLNTGNAILSNPIKVDSSYNVGIGGAASGSFKLQVTGTTNLTGALSGTSATFSGNVLMGTATSNGARLEIKQANSLDYRGLLVVDSATPNWIGMAHTGTAGVISAWYDGAGTATPLIFKTGDTTRLTIASTGAATFSSSVFATGNIIANSKLGVNNGSPITKIDVCDGVIASGVTSNVSQANIYFEGYGYVLGSNRYGLVGIGGTYNNANNHSSMDFYTSGSSGYTNKMKISTDGALLVNSSDGSVANTSAMMYLGPGVGTYNGVLRLTHSSTNVSGSGFVDFWYNTNNIGSISQNGTTAVAYNTTSDYRLKEDLKEIKGLEKISAIKVYDYKWKSCDERMDGVLAHELQEVIPYAVTGEKDAVNENGNIMPQGVDYSKIVPILVKAIQELNQTVQNQQQQINSLINR